MSENGESPKPGHFLPGGAGETQPPPGPRTPNQPSLSRARSLTPSDGAVTGRDRQTARHGQQLPPEPPRRRFSPTVIVGLVAGALVFAGLVVLASSKVVSTFTGLAKGPNVTQPPPQPEAPAPPQPSPTVTVTAPPPPTDTQVVRQNKLYGVGRLTVTCKESAYRPDSEAAAAAYYRAIATCLNNAWGPALRKAGHEFRAPRVAVYTGTSESPCGRYTGVGFYCDADESLNLPWQESVRRYEKSKIGARLATLSMVAAVYGYHVQQQAGILESWANLEAAGKSTAAKNAYTRRFKLQSECFGAVFIAAVRSSYPLTPQLVDVWTTQVRRSDVKAPATSGSRRNNGEWRIKGFTTGQVRSCNTWTAPAAKVS